jgi:hypothetical protein
VIVGCAVAAGRFEEDEQERNRSHGSSATQRAYHHRAYGSEEPDRRVDGSYWKCCTIRLLAELFTDSTFS